MNQVAQKWILNPDRVGQEKEGRNSLNIYNKQFYCNILFTYYFIVNP